METEAPDVVKITVVVTIHDAEARNRSFGQVNNAFIRIVNQDDNREIVRFDLTEDYSMETAIIFGEVYYKTGEWRFTAVGQGYAGGLAAACSQFGINAS